MSKPTQDELNASSERLIAEFKEAIWQSFNDVCSRYFDKGLVAPVKTWDMIEDELEDCMKRLKAPSTYTEEEARMTSSD